MLNLVSMRTRASFVLWVVALAQIVLLGAALGLLQLRLRELRQSLIRLGNEEQAFLNQLADIESDLYRISILIRDNIILDGAAQQQAREELVDRLKRISAGPIQPPGWVSPSLRTQVDAIEVVRKEYVARASAVAGWNEQDREVIGPSYLAGQLAPTREKFVATARQIAGLVRSLRRSTSRALADSLADVQALVLRVLLGAAVFGSLLAGFAIWRFRRYEKERDVHLRNLSGAEEGLRTLSQRLLESQETERKKLSRELHDEVGQIMTALRVQLGQIEPAGSPSASHLQQASDLAERSLRSIREMARSLRPAMLDDLGLAPALKWLGRDISKNTALEVDVAIEGDFVGLDEPLRTCVYRVVQEALTNCTKHARCSSARVALHEGPSDIVLTIEDSGAGFRWERPGGIGLLGMRERVEELNGEFALRSAPGAGTTIRVTLPKTREKHDSNTSG